MDGLVASVLAPRPFSRWLPAGVAAVLVVAGIDAAIAGELALAASLAIVTLLAALVGRLGDTVAVAGVAIAAGAISGLWNDFTLSWGYALFAIVAGGVLSLLVALLRANAVITDRRLALLRDLLGLVDRELDVDGLVERILAMLVPAFADAAAIEAEGERLGVRGATGHPADHLELALTARGTAFGTLALSLGRSGRRYSAADRGFAELVSGRVAVVLDNAGLTRQAREAEQRLIAALDTLGEAVTMNGPDGRTVYANQAAAQLLHATVEELTSTEVGEISAHFLLLDEHGGPLGVDDFPAFRALRGEDRPEPLLLRNIVRATGEERWLVNKVTVLRNAEGAIDRVVNVVQDVSEVKRAERAQALLGDATRVLAEAPEPEPALQRVAELAVDQIADWCAIDVPDGPSTRRAGQAPAGTAPPEAPGGRIVVPLMAGGEPLGSLTLVRTDAVRRFTAVDRRIAEELGHRAGAALLNGRHARERAAITRELQHGLLPPRLPDIPGLEVSALYRPAGELNEVGGDFYDAFPTPEGWMVVIGDVAGQGARAAALTGMARFTLRSVGQLTGDPVRAAEQLNRTLRDQPELSLCTAICLLLHEGDDGLEARTVSMGHPLPALLRDGAVTGLGHPGALAGAFDDEVWTASRTPLRPGDAIVLYTDGVFDTVGRDGRLGEEQLLALLRASPPGAAAVVAHVDAVLHDFQAGPQADDTALVALAVRGD